MKVDEARRTLGVGDGASSDEVRDAYRRLVRERHPDRDRSRDATEVTARLTEAYAVLRRAMAQGPPTAAPLEVKEEGDSLWLDVPADEAFAALFEAAGRVGHVAYFDRHLGLLETVVRFEGGPTCSVLVTLQGRAFGTEAFVTMESIEAAPTPPIAPVIDALVTELSDP
jgi:hypothetical protein